VNSQDVQPLGVAVLLQGAALAEIRHLALMGARDRQRRDGVPPSLTLRHALQVMTAAVNVAAATSSVQVSEDTRHGDIAQGPKPAQLGMDGNAMSTREVAVLLGVGTRQVQRLASLIGFRRVNGALVFDRHAVNDFAAQRQRRTTRD
jgi:hypothetical protein